jgi:hypothetical protein
VPIAAINAIDKVILRMVSPTFFDGRDFMHAASCVQVAWHVHQAPVTVVEWYWSKTQQAKKPAFRPVSSDRCEFQ